MRKGQIKTARQVLKEVLSERLDTSGTCWIYTGWRSPEGYGIVKVTDPSTGQRKHFRAHRFVYEQLERTISENWHLHHKCENTSCVAPWHMDMVTPEVHAMERHVTIFTKKRDATHCPQGHPYEGDNLVLDKRNRRICRICKNALSLASYYRLKEAA